MTPTLVSFLIAIALLVLAALIVFAVAAALRSPPRAIIEERPPGDGVGGV